MSLLPLRFAPRWIHAWRRLTAGREFFFLALLFAGVLTALVVLGLFAMRTLDVTRILVQGERYYATAQQRALLYLDRYARTGDERDYEGFEREIAVTVGDRHAREALAQADPDLAVARAGLLQGRNHPDDIAPFFWFYRTFQSDPGVQRADSLWTAADVELEHMQQLAVQLREAVRAGDHAAIALLLAELHMLSDRVSELGIAFTAEATQTTHRVGRMLVLLLVGGGLLLLLVLVLASRHLFKRLREGEDRYRSLFTGANDAILILDPASEQVVEANPSAARLYGLRLDQLVGLSMKALSANVAEGEARVQELYAGSGRTIFETNQRRADGTSIVVRVSASLIEHRGQALILSHNRDISARRQIEVALRASQAHLQLALDSGGMGIWDRIRDRGAHGRRAGGRAGGAQPGGVDDDRRVHGVRSPRGPASRPRCDRQSDRGDRGVQGRISSHPAGRRSPLVGRPGTSQGPRRRGQSRHDRGQFRCNGGQERRGRPPGE